MAKDKNHGEASTKSECAPGQKEILNGEFDRRLTALEKTAFDLNNRIFDSHKWFVTVLFSAVAVVLTVYGILSRLDVRDSTAEMEKRVNTATSDMEKRFQALAGEALRRPVVELFEENVPLENKLVDVTARANVTPTEIVFNTLFIKNIGDRRTEPLSIRFSISTPIRLSYMEHEGWEPAASYEKEFSASFYSTRHDTVAPGETLNIHPLALMADLNTTSQLALTSQQTNTLCKIQVFYGGEKPVEAQFRMRLTLK